MKTLMAVLLAGTAFVSTANAATTSGFGEYSLEYGTLGNPTPYGTIKVTDQGNGVAKVEENVSPNFILNNGNAGVLAPLTFNLAGNGSIDVASLLPQFSVSALASVSNPPFGSFTDAIDGNCGNGAGSGGCGSVLTFLINNFSGFTSNDIVFNNVLTSIFFATDIINVATGATGSVGAGGLIETPIPAPLALFAAGLVGIGMLKRATKKRKVVDAALA